MDSKWGIGIPEYEKKDLMSSTELKEFAIEKTLEFIAKELGIRTDKIKNITDNNEADLVAETETGTVGIKVYISVAPDKTNNYSSIKEENANKYDRYAIANILIGSCDEFRFNKRVVLKDDEFYLNYEKLHYRKLIRESKIDGVRYSLSEDIDQSWKNIYSIQELPNSEFRVEKERKSYKLEWENNYLDEIEQLCKDYNVAKRQEELSKYLILVGKSIEYNMSIKNTFLAFINSINYCKGWFLSDSEKIENSNIILTTKMLLDTNAFVELNLYEIFNFAYFVYYYLTEKIIFDDNVFDKIISSKIVTFEKNPEYFGYGHLTKTIMREMHIEENLKEMYSQIGDFLNNVYHAYASINQYINSCGITRKIDFEKTGEVFESLHEIGKERMQFLIDNFDSTANFKNKHLFLQYRKVISNFNLLLEKDIKINDKLHAKSTGEKYGWFQYIKDIIDRNSQNNFTYKLIQELYALFKNIK